MRPVLLDGFVSPVAIAASAGVYTASRLSTLAEVRATRIPIPSVCVCLDGTCLRCFLDDDAAFERRADQ